MTVFSTVLKIGNQYKFSIILYTVILVAFAGFNFKNNDNSISYVATKPDIYIVNHDEEVGITKDLIQYLSDYTNVVSLDNKEEAINDALFYRDVNYIIDIPANFRKDFLNDKDPDIKVKSTKDYNAVLAENLLHNYIKTASIYRNYISSEEDLINKIHDTSHISTDIEVTSKLDTNTLSQITFYFNFLNYSILAGCVYVICLILSSFKEKNVSKRMIISSTSYQKLNRKLLISIGIVAFLLWLFYIILAYILLGNVVLSSHGILYIINSFVFMIASLTLAFLIGNLVNSKPAINGIINVVALGSSFLCGAFVPMEWLPDFVLKIAHVLPSYWYIKTNEVIKTLEVVDIDTCLPILKNIFVLILFAVIFISAINIISKKKQKIA